jgi:hypothetical protein
LMLAKEPVTQLISFYRDMGPKMRSARVCEAVDGFPACVSRGAGAALTYMTSNRIKYNVPKAKYRFGGLLDTW